MKTKIIKAISNGARLRLLEIMKKRKPTCACELPLFIKLTQPAVSQHLKVLLEAGLVRVQKKGTRRLYSLSPLGRRVLVDISRW